MLKEKETKTLCQKMYQKLSSLSYSSSGYQISDRSNHKNTKYMMDEKTHRAIKEPWFTSFITVERDLYEMGLLKSTIEHVGDVHRLAMLNYC